MIKIMRERLDQGFDLLTITEACPNSHNCLWISRQKLFRVPGALPENCPQESCELVIFRKRFEDESPAFYAEALKLSLFDDIAQATAVVAMKRKIKKRKLAKLSRRIYDLHIFGQLLILAVYSLSLAAKEIPFLKTAEIMEFRNNYHEAEMHQTISVP